MEMIGIAAFFAVEILAMVLRGWIRSCRRGGRGRFPHSPGLSLRCPCSSLAWTSRRFAPWERSLWVPPSSRLEASLAYCSLTPWPVVGTVVVGFGAGSPDRRVRRGDSWMLGCWHLGGVIRRPLVNDGPVTAGVLSGISLVVNGLVPAFSMT